MAGVKRNESESSIQRKILEALKAKRVLAWRINSGTVRVGAHYVKGAPNGTPDIVVHLGNSEFGWLEVKKVGGKLEPSQVEWHAKAEELGIVHGVVESLEEALLLISVWRGETIRTARG